MSAAIIDGKAIAAELQNTLKDKIAKMARKPGLAVILVGDDPASHVYVGSKIRACAAVGIQSFETRLPEDASQDNVAAAIAAYNADPAVDGILLQLPVPRHLDSDALVQSIDPAKDVDGLTLKNVGALVAGLPGLVACTPQGSMHLIKSVRENVRGLDAVVIGRSLLFGKPMAHLLLAADCTVTMAHRYSENLADICRRADILVVAVGQPKMVKADWIKQGAIVIDVGINRQDNGTLCGDVDFDMAKNVASAITPVPGGAGPMTIACLLANTVAAANNLFT
jgi:methylenetetrahydrofolate dehydrogenase (NADP+)/methenyltetrahydrofolate cyclohydrolase